MFLLSCVVFNGFQFWCHLNCDTAYLPLLWHFCSVASYFSKLAIFRALHVFVAHWLKITEHIKYKLLSLTYKVFTTAQPPYLHNLISDQPPRNTRSSSHVTLARPPTSSER